MWAVFRSRLYSRFYSRLQTFTLTGAEGQSLRGQPRDLQAAAPHKSVVAPPIQQPPLGAAITLSSLWRASMTNCWSTTDKKLSGGSCHHFLKNI